MNRWARSAHGGHPGLGTCGDPLFQACSDLSPENIAPDKLEAFLEYARLEAVTGNPLSAFRSALDYARERAQENRLFNTLYRLDQVADNGHFVGYPEENVRTPDRVKPAL